jgi:exopolyphosphatase/guanosine-5'-triphosphate,3'-diphosphate pyrophosphatase
VKFAAIDIGSNAVRLFIARPLHLGDPDTEFKAVEFTRLPLRLGDDVFRDKEISKKKAELLEKAMQAFSLLMEIYNVDAYRACATSAMRDARNAKKIQRDIRKATGIKIDVINGREESRLVQGAIMNWLPSRHNFLHIDVGGGSTEITLIRKGKAQEYESFNVGTVRMREGRVDKNELTRMEAWLKQYVMHSPDLRAIGTGGNIVKLHELAGCKSNDSLNLRHLEGTTEWISGLSHEERVYELKLNPDRAEVIDHAGRIFLQILKTCDIHEIYAPDKGLKDGIIRHLWTKHLLSQNLSL